MAMDGREHESGDGVEEHLAHALSLGVVPSTMARRHYTGNAASR